MLFKVTHIDPAGHRHRARVTAPNASDAMEQADRLWGDAQAMACVRMQTHPVLFLLTRASEHLPQAGGRAVCGS